MNIDPNDPRLTAFVLGELDASEHAIVEAYLTESSDCRQAVDEIRMTTRWLAQQLQEESLAHQQDGYSSTAVAGVINNHAGAAAESVLKAESPRRGWWRLTTPRMNLIAAAILVLVGLAVLPFVRVNEQRKRALDQAAAAKAVAAPSAPSPEHLNLYYERSGGQAGPADSTTLGLSPAVQGTPGTTPVILASNGERQGADKRPEAAIELSALAAEAKDLYAAGDVSRSKANESAPMAAAPNGPPAAAPEVRFDDSKAPLVAGTQGGGLANAPMPARGNLGDQQAQASTRRFGKKAVLLNDARSSPAGGGGRMMDRGRRAEGEAVTSRAVTRLDATAPEGFARGAQAPAQTGKPSARFRADKFAVEPPTAGSSPGPTGE
jgi:hypothetical protein